MTLEDGKKMLTWSLAASGPKKLVAIHWFGYEPMMSFKLIKNLTEYGDDLLKGTLKSYKWSMTSNLTLINSDVNRFLRKNKYRVLCSIDGTEESHNRYRVYPNGRGSFKDAFAGLKRLLSWDKSRTVRWTISPDTVDQILSGTELYLEHGVHHIAHEFVNEINWSKADLEALESELTKTIPLLIEHTRHAEVPKPVKGRRGREKPRKDLHPLPDFKPFRDGWRIYSEQRMKDRCGLGKGDIGVNVEGEFYLCHRFVDQKPFKVGDIYKGLNLKLLKKKQAAWSTQNIVAWDGKRETCYTCIGRMACNGACLATNWDVNKNLFQPSRSHCEILPIKVRLAIKLEKALRKENLLEKYNSNKRVQKR